MRKTIIAENKEPQKEILIYKENTENDETVLKEKSGILYCR